MNDYFFSFEFAIYRDKPEFPLNLELIALKWHLVDISNEENQ